MMSYGKPKNFSFNNNGKVDQLKQQLINYVYETIELSKFKFRIIQFESELPQLLEKKYFVSANFSGSNCLLVFTKIGDRYQTVMIDRKTLNYNISKIDISKINLFDVKLYLDSSIYLGTIFDGIFIQSKFEKIFVITDIYCFKGQDLTCSSLEVKMMTVVAYLKSNYDEQDLKNSIKLRVNKLFKLSEFETLCNDVISKTKKEYNVRGICFYPDISDTKLIYLFGENKQIETIDKNKIPNVKMQQNNVSSSMMPRHSESFFMNKHSELFPTHDQIESIEITKTNEIIKTKNKTNNTNNTNNANNTNNNELKNELKIVNDSKKIVKQYYVPKLNVECETYVFEMVKTENSDVYILNAVEPITKENKTHLKRRKIDLAFVPNLERSKWCKEIMSESNNNVLVNCKYHHDKYKWEPISESSAKRPSFITDFDIVTREILI